MDQTASCGTFGEKQGTVPQETRVLGLPERIRAFRLASGLSQRRMAHRLGVGNGPFGLWCQGRVYPPKRVWPVLVAAGICTEFELSAWRPRRPKRYSLRGVKLIPLHEYASRYRPDKAVGLADAARSKAG